MALSPASSVAFHSSGMPFGKQRGSIGRSSDGLIIVRILEAVVKNKFANNPGKLAAWLTANHVEEAPVKKKPPAP